MKRYEKVLEDQFLNPRVKINLLKMIEIADSLQTKEEREKAEEVNFTIDGRILDDKEKIAKELSNLILLKTDYDQEKVIELLSSSEPTILDPEKEILNNGSSVTGIERIKIELTKEQLKNNIMPNFVSVFDEFLDKYLDNLSELNPDFEEKRLTF